MATNSRQRTSVFRGLNNVADPLRLDMSWFTRADNIDISNRNAVTRCRGFVQRTTNYAVSGAYATKDLQHLYVVDTGELRAYNPNLTYEVLATGLSSDKMQFCEVNGRVYLTNGTDFKVIEKGVCWPWGVPPPSSPPTLAAGSGGLVAGTYSVLSTLTDGRGMESGNSPVATITVGDNSQIIITDLPQTSGYTTNVYVTAPNGATFMLLKEASGASATYNCPPESLGEELVFWELDLPRGTLPEYFGGRMYVAEVFAPEDQTVIWASWPFHYHHFDYGEDAVVVPGIVRMLKAAPEALIIGTDRGIFAYNGESLEKLADYGVVPGWHASELEGKLYFWSLRGLCRVLPFDNLTQNTVSVPPGLSAGAMVLEQDGARRYVVALHKGGVAYNKR